VTLGGGGVSWKYLNRRTKQTISPPGQKATQFDYFLKTAGGFDFFFSPRVLWTLGAAYRYALTDEFDFIATGDKNDAMISAFTGFTVSFGKMRGDADHDGVMDRYDLNSKLSEDRDGYLDHDGVPDKRISDNIAAFVRGDENNGGDKVPPIVLHKPVLHTTVGQALRLQAEVFENQNLRKTAILYRPANIKNWLVAPLNATRGNLYTGIIPGQAVQAAGLEYCIVAVDEAISGVGYSGLPDRPNFVRVHGSETGWRIITGLAAAIGWGGAGYLVFGK